MRILRKFFTKEIHFKHTVAEEPNHILYIFGFSLLPILISLYLIFTIFKLVVSAYLWLRLGEKFHGLLRGADAIWAIEAKEWRNIIPIIYFVASDTDTCLLDKVKEQMKERVFDHPHDYRKLTSTYEKFLGYIYLLYDTYTLEECVKPMDVCSVESKFITEEDLKDFLEKYGQSPMPHNGKALWEILVSPKPMLEEENGQVSYIYPVLVKIHHMVGDGAAMVAFTDKIWGTNKINTYLDNIMKSKSRADNNNKHHADNLEQTIWYFLRIIGQYCELAYVWVGTLIHLIFIREQDNNALHGRQLSGEKVVTWTWEEKDELVPLVKKIKQSIPNTSFNDVVYTALSASVSDFLDEHNFSKPDHLYTAVPVIMSLRNVQKPGPAVLHNDFSMIFFKLPTKKHSLCNNFKAVKEQFSYLKTNQHIVKISYLTVQYVINPFPLPIIDVLSTVLGVTLSTSNLPGGDMGTTLGNHLVKHLLFFTLNRWKTGITASVITYNNRFHISFLVDKALIFSRNELHQVCLHFFKNIKHLADELTIKST